MSTYITLGADEYGQVYGVEVGDGGVFRKNPLGYSTSCAVIRPITKDTYEYMTEDPESVREYWKAAVSTDQTDEGLKEFFDGCTKDDLIDSSWVWELLEDVDNQTIAKWNESHCGKTDDDDDGSESEDDTFRDYVERMILESYGCQIIDPDEIYEWESSGWWAPEKKFVVEFAPREVLDAYYDHLRKCGKFKD